MKYGGIPWDHNGIIYNVYTYTYTYIYIYIYTYIYVYIYIYINVYMSVYIYIYICGKGKKGIIASPTIWDATCLGGTPNKDMEIP